MNEMVTFGILPGLEVDSGEGADVGGGGQLVLLAGQPEPRFGQVFETVLPCLSYLPKYLGEVGPLARFRDIREMRTGLWENRSLDGKDRYVSPAFNHPKSIEDSASLFYAAYPDKQRLCPDSPVDFEPQLQGIPDEKIVVTFWYAEHVGTRGIIAASDFVLELLGGLEGFREKLREQDLGAVHLLTPQEIERAKEKVSRAPGDWGGSWKMIYPWQSTSWQAGNRATGGASRRRNQWPDEVDQDVIPIPGQSDAEEEFESAAKFRERCRGLEGGNRCLER